MSHPTRDRLARSRAKLLGLITGLSEDTLDFRPAGDPDDADGADHDDGWTIRQYVTHLLASEEDHAQVIQVVMDGETERLPGEFDLDRHNAARLVELGRLTLPELLDSLADQRRRSEALFDRLLAADQLDLTVPHPARGELALGDIFRVLSLHEQQHARDIAGILGQMGG